jgi:hypothetical protein
MFVAFMAIVILASVPLTGGKVTRLARIRIRGWQIIAVALVIQVVITGPLQSWPHGVLVGMHLASYGLIGFVVWWNRRLPGLLVIALGGFMNAAVIALNDGTLPASARALAQAGTDLQKNFNNSNVLPHPVVPQLGDIVATPAWLPFRNVISIGDVVALVGVVIMVHLVSDSIPTRWVLRLLGQLRLRRTAPFAVIAPAFAGSLPAPTARDLAAPKGTIPSQTDARDPAPRAAVSPAGHAAAG